LLNSTIIYSCPFAIQFYKKMMANPVKTKPVPGIKTAFIKKACSGSRPESGE
jgi:hypothetical protein